MSDTWLETQIRVLEARLREEVDALILEDIEDQLFDLYALKALQAAEAMEDAA